MIPENSAGQVWATSPGCLPLFLGLGSLFGSAKVWSSYPVQGQPGAGLS